MVNIKIEVANRNRRFRHFYTENQKIAFLSVAVIWALRNNLQTQTQVRYERVSQMFNRTG